MSSNDSQIRISIFDRIDSPEAAAVTLTRNEFAEFFTEHEEVCDASTCPGRDCPSKLGTDLWGPYVLSGSRRSNDNVRTYDVLAFDLDHLPAGGLAQLEAAVEGCDCLIASTHSHAPGDECYRVAFYLTRDITRDEYPLVRAAVIAALGLPGVDAATGDLARCYARPKSRRGIEPVARRISGTPLDVDSALAAAGCARNCERGAEPCEASSHAVERVGWTDFARRASRRARDLPTKYRQLDRPRETKPGRDRGENSRWQRARAQRRTRRDVEPRDGHPRDRAAL